MILTVIEFLDWRTDLERIYADVDIVALTSKDDGSPVGPHRGLAHDRPLVAMNVGCVADVVGESVNGLPVAPGDAVAGSGGSTAADARLGPGARLASAAEVCAWSACCAERLVSDIEGLYTALLADREVPS